MEIKIGEVIRQLRLEQSITQERLADYLKVSPQSVSKWENGLSYPDITSIPKIATFFRVSTDELFSLSTSIDNRKFISYQVAYEALQRKGAIQEQIVLSRQMFVEYPRNYRVMSNLASSLIACYEALDYERQLAIENHYLNEAIKLNELILSECNDLELKLNATKVLCKYYPHINQVDKALTLANTLPNMEGSKNLLLEEILIGEQCIKQQQSNLLELMDRLAQGLVRLSFVKGKNISNLTVEERMQFIKASNSLYKIILPDENYLYFHSRLAENYRRLAELYLINNGYDESMSYLKLSFKHAQLYDALPAIDPYTSLFVSKCSFDTKDLVKSHEKSACQLLYYRLAQQGSFDALENRSDFEVLKQNLIDIIN